MSSKDISVPEGETAHVLSAASLKKRGTYEATASAQMLLKDLDLLKTIDKGAERRQLYWGLACIAPVIGFFVSASMDSGPGAALAIGLLVFFIIMCIKSGKLNVPDRRYLLAQDLITVLSRDMSPAEKILIRLDINKVDCKQNQLARRMDRTVYRSNWLNISTTLADSSRVSISVFENLHVKFRKGKVKNKGFDLRLGVVFSKKNYGQLELSQTRSRQLVRLTAPALLKSLRCRGNLLLLNVKSPPSAFMKEADIASDLSQTFKQLMLASYETLRVSLQESGRPAS